MVCSCDDLSLMGFSVAPPMIYFATCTMSVVRHTAPTSEKFWDHPGWLSLIDWLIGDKVQCQINQPINWKTEPYGKLLIVFDFPDLANLSHSRTLTLSLSYYLTVEISFCCTFVLLNSVLPGSGACISLTPLLGRSTQKWVATTLIYSLNYFPGVSGLRFFLF